MILNKMSQLIVQRQQFGGSNSGLDFGKVCIHSNIFDRLYSIRQVHTLSNNQILYEAVISSVNKSKFAEQRCLIHQFSVINNRQNQSSIFENLREIASFQYVSKIYIDGINEQKIEEFSHNNFTQEQILTYLLRNEQNFQIRAVIDSQYSFQLKQIKQKPDFIRMLNQFLQFFNLIMKNYQHLSDIKCQNLIFLQDKSSHEYLIYQQNLNLIETKSKELHLINGQLKNNQNNETFIEKIIKLYLLSYQSKKIKEFLLFRNKNLSQLLQLYSKRFDSVEMIEFTTLLRNISENTSKYTEKMVICYIQIMKQKYLNNQEQKKVILKTHKNNLIHQAPQSDKVYHFSTEKKQKISHSFTTHGQNKTKSQSRKLKIQKQNQQFEESFRYDTRKASSMIAMSPNRKNRKYAKCSTKYSTTGLFSNNKQNFQRSSSSSFLTKSSNNINKNTGNDFYNKNFYQTTNSGFQSTYNSFYKESIQHEKPTADNQVKNYLQTMGFGHKKPQSKQFKEGLNYSQESIVQKEKVYARNSFGKVNPNNFDKQKSNHKFKQSIKLQNGVAESKYFPEPLDKKYNLREVSSLSSSVHEKIDSQMSVLNPRSRNDLLQRAELISDADLKKQRIQQSLAFFQRKSQKFNSSTFNEVKNHISQNLCKNSLPHKIHNSITPQQNEDESQSQQGPISETIVDRNVEISYTQLQKQQNFKIMPLKQMNMKISCKRKNKNLRIQKATVMIMHLNSLSNSNKASQCNHGQKVLKGNQNVSNEHQKIQQFKENSSYIMKKPSLKDVKKEKQISKEQNLKLKTVTDKNIQSQVVIEKEKQKTFKMNGSKLIQKQSYSQPLQRAHQSQNKKNHSSMSKPQSQELQTSYLSKNPSTNSINQSNISISTNVNVLSKQFFKQIFLYINSQNKSLVDLLGSKLSYQITFYAFYINYFKLNVTKTTTKQAIQKMLVQMRQYQTKIVQSEKFGSQQKMIPQYQNSVKKLLKIDIQAFTQLYWKRDQLKGNSLKQLQKSIQEIDQLSIQILKISLKIVQQRLQELKQNEKGIGFIIKSLKVCTTIAELIYCVQKKLVSLSVGELKKINQIAAQNNSSQEKKWTDKIGKYQQLIESYNSLLKQSENDQSMRVNIKGQNRKIQSILSNE